MLFLQVLGAAAATFPPRPGAAAVGGAAGPCVWGCLLQEVAFVPWAGAHGSCGHGVFLREVLQQWAVRLCWGEDMKMAVPLGWAQW